MVKTATATIAASAKQGPPGPDGWAEPIQQITQSVGGALVIDYAAGKFVEVTLNAPVTGLAVINWPPVGYYARLQLRVKQSGGFAFAFPAGVRPVDQGPPPVVSSRAGAIDTFIIDTTDAGATKCVYVAGQNF